MTSGYRVFRTKKFKKIIRSTKSREFAFYFESLFRFHKNKIKIYEVPIKYHKRLYGQSKMNLFNTMFSYINLTFILIKIFLYEK